MKKFFGFLTMIALFAILAGCSPYSLVNSDVYNGANLRSFTTFRIVTPQEGKLPPGMTMVTYYNIAAAVREQMVERGYTEDPDSPLLINLGLTVKKEIATEPAIPPGAYPYGGPYYNGIGPWFMYPRGYYWPDYYNYYSNAQLITGIYREGVLTMDMVDIADKVAVYSSSVATILDNGDTQFRNLEGIAEAVKTLFSQFPVKVLPQYRN